VTCQRVWTSYSVAVGANNAVPALARTDTETDPQQSGAASVLSKLPVPVYHWFPAVTESCDPPTK
jgi:hypothetical protein